MPKYYAPFDTAAHELLGHAVPAQQFAGQLSGADAATFSAALKGTGLDSRRMRVVPISSNRGDASMLVDAEDGHPLKPVAVDPWPALNSLKRGKTGVLGPSVPAREQ